MSLSGTLRPILAHVIDPVAKFLLRLGISPDAITITGTILTSFAALLLIPSGYLFLGSFFIEFSRFFDLLDGTMARLSGRTGNWGAFLDSTLDRIADGAIFSAITMFFVLRAMLRINRLDLWCVVAALACLALGAVVPYARARAAEFGVEAKSGVFERPARILLAVVPLALMQFGLPQIVVFWSLVVLAIGSLITVIQRMLNAKRGLVDA